MKIIKEGHVLESKTRTGLNKYWQGLIYQDHEQYFIGSRHWQTKKDGESTKVTDSVPYAVVSKNIGKANETSPAEQAVLEFDSMIKKQMDKNYLPNGVSASLDKLPLPMLAQKYIERKHKITFPAFVQPKLNGMRMAFDGNDAQSRGGKPIIPEVIEHLRFLTKMHTILDGELILPGNPPLQETMKAVKKFRPELSPTLLYCVYDKMCDGTFEERYERLKHMFSHKGIDMKAFDTGIKLVETYEVNNEEDIKRYHKQFTLAGYEGTIIRNKNGLYAYNQRSNDLQKFKDFIDAEFKIVDVIQSGESGLYEGCAKFVCITSNGKQFHCNPEGTIEYKKELYRDREKYLNKWLTIRYQELTNDKVPQFPVGIDIRDDGEF